MNITEQSLELILHTKEFPKAVTRQADSFNFQSSTVIPLKPNQEPARSHICCVLAVEKLGEKYRLPLPDTRKPPIPPAQYTKLLSQFRNVLVGSETPSKMANRGGLTNGSPSPSKTDPRTPTKDLKSTPSRTRTPRSSRSKLNFRGLDLDGEDGDSSDEELGYLKFEPEEDEVDLPITPRKRAPAGPAAGSPSPRKSPRKGVNPSAKLIKEIAARMGLKEATIDVVVEAFEKYSELVKDEWGLVYGLLVVISDRAEPQQGAEHERQLFRALGEVAPSVQVNQVEWIEWTEKIVSGQTWIMNISQKPEPQPVLIGAAGGWGMGIEWNLLKAD